MFSRFKKKDNTPPRRLTRAERKIIVRSDRRSVWLGKLLGWFMRIWELTLRVKNEDPYGMTGPNSPRYQIIFLLWHSRVFAMPPVWWKRCGKWRNDPVILSSASDDGAVVAAAMGVFGMTAVRGSSSRRGTAALIALKRALNEGHDICVTPDGPKGPRYHIQPGVIKLAQTTQKPIVPAQIVCHCALRLKTWDRLVIPLPFSRVTLIHSQPIHIPADLDEAAFEAERLRVENTMLAITEDV